jgi:hypothetical protein
MKYYIIVFLLLVSGCKDIEENKPLLADQKGKQPIFIVNRNRHFKMAEFWLDKLENPDRVILDSDAIERFNTKLISDGKVYDFNRSSRFYSGSYIRASIEGMYKNISNGVKYFIDGNRVSRSFFREIYSDLDLDSIDSKERARFALTIRYANQKLIPVELELLKRRGEIYFDRNQNSALDIGTPLVVLHSTRDGRWHFVVAPTSSGWVRDEDIAFGSKEEILDYLNPKNFVVTIDAKSAILVEGNYYDYVRMGVKFPALLGVDKNIVIVVPQKGEDGNLIFLNGMISKSSVNRGYLTYTPRNILIQAFKFLNAPYGWGGSFGEQDCSKFVQEVFATVGLRLPRNSTTQSLVGYPISLNGLTKEEKIDNILRIAEVGSTIIHLKGHIMLYIGEHKGEPFVIQTVWGESSRHFALGRTAVTSLRFNDYINRVDFITILRDKLKEGDNR